MPVAALAQLSEPDSPGTLDIVDVQERVVRAFEAEERVPVFILLREDTLAMDERKRSVADALGGEFEQWHSYRNIPAIAGLLSRSGLAQLRHSAAVSAVQLDGKGSGGLAEALPAVGVDKVQSVRGLSGKGVTVAVLDSGASTQHPALQGAFVAQHCFTRRACPPDRTVESESAEDDHGHGSNVTGIVGSRGGGVSKGYAPAASLVAVKVLNGQNAGQTSDWVAGFDWVLSNHDKLKIKVINASLVSDAEYANAADCDRSETAMASVVKKLVDAGITITASSGNTGHTATMTSPSCNTGVIAVGATYDKDLGRQPEGGPSYQALGGSRWPACSDAVTNRTTLACFTSTAGPRLDLLAPGSQITSVGRGTASSMFRGTSQAAPGVAGLAALLLECNPALTPAMILDVLKKTGEPVVDPRNNMMYPLIRGVEAADMACSGMPGGPVGTAGSAAPIAGGGAGAAAVGAAGSGGLAAGSGAADQPAAVGGSTAPVVPAAGSSSVPGAAGARAVGVAAGSGGRSTVVFGGAGTGTGAAQAGTGQRSSAVTASAGSGAPASDSGCQCAAPGAVRSTAHSQRFSLLLGLGFLGYCVRRRTLVRARKRAPEAARS